MKRYKDINGGSGISLYGCGPDYISIKFKDTETIYSYNYVVTGKKHVEKMKQLAEKGSGLSTYIAQNPEVRNNYLVS